MNIIGYLLSGGFAKGYRTYILGALLIAQALGSWAVGDMTGIELLQKFPELIAGAGLMSLRAAIPTDSGS